MATNTIGGVNLAAIAEMSLPALLEEFAPLTALTADFSTEIAQRGSSVATRFPSRPTAVDLSSGYSAGNSTATSATINLDQFFGWVWEFSDFERSRASIDLNALFVEPAIAAVGTKVFGDLWNLVNDTNFPATIATETAVGAASSFDLGDVASLAAQLTTNGVPKRNRALILNPTYYAALADQLNDVSVAGQGRTLGEHVIPRIHGFDVFESPLCDGNGVNVVGLACHSTALMIAARGVDAPSEPGLEVENVVVPGLGLPIQFRRWYNRDTGQLKYSMGVLYGVQSAMGAAGARPAGIKIVST